jgi:hypothetical protein
MCTGAGVATLRWRGIGILGLLSCSRSRLPKVPGPPCCRGVLVRWGSVYERLAALTAAWWESGTGGPGAFELADCG